MRLSVNVRGCVFFIGVFAVDNLPNVTKFPATLIVNTDPAYEAGEHWVALHLKPRGRVDYFCSFGFPPLILELQDFVNRYGSSGKRYNRCTMQDVNSTLCGDYCICFVKCIAKGAELPEFVARFTCQPLARPGENKGRLTCVKWLSQS